MVHSLQTPSSFKAAVAPPPLHATTPLSPEHPCRVPPLPFHPPRIVIACLNGRPCSKEGRGRDGWRLGKTCGAQNRDWGSIRGIRVASVCDLCWWGKGGKVNGKLSGSRACTQLVHATGVTRMCCGLSAAKQRHQTSDWQHLHKKKYFRDCLIRDFSWSVWPLPYFEKEKKRNECLVGLFSDIDSINNIRFIWTQRAIAVERLSGT